jgi:uncharacterized protein with FMN-binding domain
MKKKRLRTILRITGSTYSSKAILKASEEAFEKSCGIG